MRGSGGCLVVGVGTERRALLRRVAIFEKLASITETSFDDADLLQLYQAQSLLDPPGMPPEHQLFASACYCHISSCASVCALLRSKPSFLQQLWQSQDPCTASKQH